jgi:hypothetical protein
MFWTKWDAACTSTSQGCSYNKTRFSKGCIKSNSKKIFLLLQNFNLKSDAIIYADAGGE